jgi:cytochrome c oxidase assembly protein subunit 15
VTPVSTSHRWLCRYAGLTTLATLGLIGLGGLVTSHGAGMAVPDWPTTYGYNMFLFPISQWVGGVFYEHTHRLYASVVGLMTVVLALWLQFRAEERWVARLGWLALALVIVQGVLGGLRVNLMKDQIGVFHAALAQGFLVLLALITLFTSAIWKQWRASAPRVGRGLHRWLTGATVLIALQLLIGATMRHQHAGLAVPDFPLAYGQIWPPTDEASLQRINALRIDSRDFPPITPFHIYLHMAHRLVGMVVAGAVIYCGLRLRRGFRASSFAGRLGTLWMTLVLVQVFLGAATVWWNKAADITTAHVVVGACCLLVGSTAAAWTWVAARDRAQVRGVVKGAASASRLASVEVG